VNCASTEAHTHVEEWGLPLTEENPCLREFRKKFTSGASTRQTYTITNRLSCRVCGKVEKDEHFAHAAAICCP